MRRGVPFRVLPACMCKRGASDGARGRGRRRLRPPNVPCLSATNKQREETHETTRVCVVRAVLFALCEIKIRNLSLDAKAIRPDHPRSGASAQRAVPGIAIRARGGWPTAPTCAAGQRSRLEPTLMESAKTRPHSLAAEQRQAASCKLWSKGGVRDAAARIFFRNDLFVPSAFGRRLAGDIVPHAFPCGTPAACFGRTPSAEAAGVHILSGGGHGSTRAGCESSARRRGG